MLITDKLLARTVLPLIPSAVTPNRVTVFRFVMIPIVLYLLYINDYLYGLLAFLLAAFSDAVDGAMARTRNQITDWGKLYDPLADKLLVSSVVALVVTQVLGWVVAFIIIGMELLIILGAIYNKEKKEKVVSAHPVAKLKMVCQSLGIAVLLTYLVVPDKYLLLIATSLLYLSIGLAVVASVIYRSI